MVLSVRWTGNHNAKNTCLRLSFDSSFQVYGSLKSKLFSLGTIFFSKTSTLYCNVQWCSNNLPLLAPENRNGFRRPTFAFLWHCPPCRDRWEGRTANCSDRSWTGCSSWKPPDAANAPTVATTTWNTRDLPPDPGRKTLWKLLLK